MGGWLDLLSLSPQVQVEVVMYGMCFLDLVNGTGRDRRSVGVVSHGHLRGASHCKALHCKTSGIVQGGKLSQAPKAQERTDWINRTTYLPNGHSNIIPRTTDYYFMKHHCNCTVYNDMISQGEQRSPRAHDTVGDSTAQQRWRDRER